MFDCGGTETLPGSQVDIAHSVDDCVQRVAAATAKLVVFFKQVFGRNSIDNKGCDIRSSVHYSRGYCNAAWSGGRMIYGDGDGYLFTDFTRSLDFIGHELMHGVTESARGLGYTREPGALNESVSDVFGSLFRQWTNGETSDSATWQIGADLIAPQGHAHGWACIRDMAEPQSSHCVSPQTWHYSQYVPGGEPHENSGIPNFVFYHAATAFGGHAWEVLGQVWYQTLCSRRIGSAPSFLVFANETLRQARQLFPSETQLPKIIVEAWATSGVITASDM